ncbi:amino acid transporter [Gammaproteobacteria bacterium ESL0073]|nr:amino acid transporter [Gammaproteobacteria bacterium ESL0073]
MYAMLAGFSLGLSLIVAIGAQNAFILRQGLYRQHVFWVCLVCAVSDAILISIGVFGLSFVIKFIPSLEWVVRYIGFAFLFCYGAISFWRAFTNHNALKVSEQSGRSLKSTVLICLALTWLNPHVYLDTVLLLGSIANQYSDGHGYFAIGAIGASFVFFFALGYGARLLKPLFTKPMSWRILDGLIGAVMWFIAVKLII